MSEKIHRGKIKTPPDPLVVKYLIEPGIQNDIKYRYQAGYRHARNRCGHSALQRQDGTDGRQA